MSSLRKKITSGSFPDDFFSALNSGNEDDAMDYLKAAALPEGVPSPKAAALIKSGEWDKSQKLSLVLIEADVCIGKIGTDGYRFCGKPKNTCKTQAHSKVTIDPIQRGWYISLSKIHGVFTSPFLPAVEQGGPITNRGAAKLFDGDRPFKLTKGMWKFVIDSWYASKVDDPVDEYDTLGAAQPSSSVLDPDIEAPTLLLDTGTNILSKDRLDDPLEGLPDLEEVPKSSPTLTVNIEKPTTNQPLGTSNATEVTIGTFLNLVQKVDALSEQLEHHIVKGEEDRTRILHLQKQLDTVTSEKDQLNSTVVSLRAHVSGQERSLQGAINSMRTTFKTVGSRISDLEKNSGQGLSTDVTVAQIEQKDQLDRLNQAVLGSDGLVSRLKKQFLDFKEATESGGAFDCHGVTFRSKNDFLDWYEESTPDVELFLDGIAYLHAMRSPVVTVEESNRQLESHIKTEMRNSLEAAVKSSFDTVIPSILIGGKKASDTGGGTFLWLKSYLKTYNEWKPLGVSHGVSHQITDGIPKITNRVTDLRSAQTRSLDHQALLLSTGMCADAVNFCSELVRFMNDQYTELTANTTYSGDRVWEMQLMCLQKILEELNEARGSVTDAAKYQPGLYLWGMYKAWKVQQRYIENHFKNDPALTGIMVRNILMQSEDVSIKKQLDKVEVIERKVEEHNRQQNAELRKLRDQLQSLQNNRAK